MANEVRTEGNIPQSRESEDFVKHPCHPCLQDGSRYEATGICTDCQEYLCQKCFDIHTLPTPSRNHKLMTQDQINEKMVSLEQHDRCSEKCNLHDDEIIKYYCTFHCTLGCSVCVTLNHRTCKDVTYIPKAAKNLASNSEFQEVENQLNDMVKKWTNMKESRQHKTNTITKQCSEAVQMLSKFKKDMSKHLVEIETDLIEKCEAKKSEGMKNVDEIVGTCGMAEVELDAFVAKLATCRKEHRNCGMYTSLMKEKSKLRSMENEIKNAERELTSFKQQIKFSPNIDTMNAIKSPGAFGQLSEGGFLIRPRKLGTSVGEEAMAASEKTLPAKPLVKADFIMTLEVKYTSEQKKGVITGIVSLKGNKLVIIDSAIYNYLGGNNDVKVFDLCQYKVTARLELFSGLWDVAMVTESLVVVTVPRDRSLVFIKVSASALTVEKTLKLQGECWGVDCRNDTLAVSFVNPDKVQVLTLKGDVLHNVENIGQISDPRYVVFSKDTFDLFVSNSSWGKDSVVRVLLDGTVVAKYTDTELDVPAGLFTDNLGNVYVCGSYTDNVHQITPHCKKIRILLDWNSGLSPPLSICYNETKKEIYVGMDGGVNVYKALFS